MAILKELWMLIREVLRIKFDPLYDQATAVKIDGVVYAVDRTVPVFVVTNKIVFQDTYGMPHCCKLTECRIYFIAGEKMGAI